MRREGCTHETSAPSSAAEGRELDLEVEEEEEAVSGPLRAPAARRLWPPLGRVPLLSRRRPRRSLISPPPPRPPLMEAAAAAVASVLLVAKVALVALVALALSVVAVVAVVLPLDRSGHAAPAHF